MLMPGFTAEVSLYETGRLYQLAAESMLNESRTFHAWGGMSDVVSPGDVGTVVPQLGLLIDVCFPRSYPCYSYADGSIGYCPGIWCTESGWEAGAGPPPGI